MTRQIVFVLAIVLSASVSAIAQTPTERPFFVVNVDGVTAKSPSPEQFNRYEGTCRGLSAGRVAQAQCGADVQRMRTFWAQLKLAEIEGRREDMRSLYQAVQNHEAAMRRNWPTVLSAQ